MSAHDPALAEIVGAARARRASASTRPPAHCAATARSSTSIRPSSRGSKSGSSAIHDLARKHRVRPEALPALARRNRGAASQRSPNPRTPRGWRSAPPRPRPPIARWPRELSAKRELAAHDLEARVTEVDARPRDGGRAARDRVGAARDARELRRRAGRVSRREPSEAAARAAREGRLGRRAVADRAVDPGGDERSRRGADADLRRGRRRHRRRGRGDGRRTAAGAGRDGGRCSA